MPTELTGHCETKNRGRQLQVTNGSVYYWVIYSQSGIGMWWTTIGSMFSRALHDQGVTGTIYG